VYYLGSVKAEDEEDTNSVSTASDYIELTVCEFFCHFAGCLLKYESLDADIAGKVEILMAVVRDVRVGRVE
jgi:hypothetical protein